MAAPDLFELEDDDAIVTVLVASPPADRIEAARKAVQMCRVGALALED